MRYLTAGLASALLLVSPMSPVLLQSEMVQAQTLQDRKAEGAGEALQEANRLWEKGLQQYQASNYPAAIQFWEKALAIYQNLKDRNSEAKVLNGLGTVYNSLSQYSKAIGYYQQALPIFQAGQNRNWEAAVMNNLCLTYNSLSQYNKAIEYCQQALPIFRAVQNRNGEAYALMNLGIAYDSLSQSNKAIEYYQQALQIYQAVQNRDGEAEALTSLGLAYDALSQYNKAINYHQQALSTFRTMENRRGEAAALANLGKSYNALSQYSKAIEFYQQALPILRAVQNRNGEALVLTNLGLAYTFLSQYSKAIEFHQQALLVFQAVQDRNGKAATLTNLGLVYASLSQYSKAIEFYQQALPIFQAVGNRNGEALLLINLGVAYDALSQYATAIKIYQQGLTIFQAVGNRNGEATTLMSLGNAYYSLSLYSKAIEFYQQALPIYRAVQDRNGEALLLMNLGVAYDALSQYGKTIDYYQQALPIYRAVGDRSGEGTLLSNIGILLERQKQPELAIIFYKQSVNVREKIREGISKLPRESQEAYAQSVAGTYRSLADLLIQQGRLPEAQAVLELLKLRELRDFTRDAGIDSPGINLARVEDAALKQILQRYATVGEFSQKIDACEQTHCPELKQLRDQRDQLNQAVTTELTQQRAILTKYFATESATLTPDKLTPEARDIVNAQPGTILIYPLILKTKIQFLIALKAGDGAVVLRPVETPNVSAETLFKTIQTFRQQLQSPGNLAALQATSQQLYTWLIKPLEPELSNPAIKHLVFAPDSTTRYIPLAALFDGKRYLIERFSISTITAASETDTSETFAQLPVNDRFLLATGASTFANANPLENVPAELNAIVKPPNSRDQQGIYPGAELLNTQFDFEALKANLKGHRVLHIATHGSFQPGRVEDSYLLSGRSEKLTTTLINQLGQYGLKGIHLVVLSACETAVGDRASDGIEIPGISYFFLKNKVKAVMASLWSVNDASTSLMMQQFYKQLAMGTMTKAEALQIVQQQFIAGKLTAKDAPSRSPTLIPKGNSQTRQTAKGDFSHPFYWAPFILIGNSL